MPSSTCSFHGHSVFTWPVTPSCLGILFNTTPQLFFPVAPGLHITHRHSLSWNHASPILWFMLSLSFVLISMRGLENVLGSKVTAVEVISSHEREDADRKEMVDLGGRRESGMEGHGVWGPSREEI